VSPLRATSVSSPVLPATSCWAIDRPPGSGMQLANRPAISATLSRLANIRRDMLPHGCGTRDSLQLSG
jgi:hypothetical protein